MKKPKPVCLSTEARCEVLREIRKAQKIARRREADGADVSDVYATLYRLRVEMRIALGRPIENN